MLTASVHIKTASSIYIHVSNLLVTLSVVKHAVTFVPFPYLVLNYYQSFYRPCKVIEFNVKTSRTGQSSPEKSWKMGCIGL